MTFDIYFRQVQDMCIAVEAESVEQAEKLFFEKYARDRKELLSRFNDAVGFMGVEITEIDYVEDDNKVCAMYA